MYLDGDAISTWPNTIAPNKTMKGISDVDKEKTLGGNAQSRGCLG